MKSSQGLNWINSKTTFAGVSTDLNAQQYHGNLVIACISVEKEEEENVGTTTMHDGMVTTYQAKDYHPIVSYHYLYLITKSKII